MIKEQKAVIDSIFKCIAYPNLDLNCCLLIY